ncbi:MAG TPA: M36 family metallopeptidase [Actinomycetota bacterium]|nr:M36 family metallopeptidase [Actinomycetota bacterium]
MARRLWAGLVPVLVVVLVVPLALAGTPGSGGLVDVFDSKDRNVDARSGHVEPTAAQRDAVRALGATATWNEFGTPHSLIKHGGYLATGVSGADAVDAARNWVEANESLFRLDASSLGLRNDAELSRSDGHAVVFEQRFGGVSAAEGGLLTVGIEGSAADGWNVAYASSTITGDTALAAEPRLSPTDAWLRAATDAGLGASSGDVGAVKDDRGWSVFSVDGFSVPQRARRVAVPTPQDGVRPAWETLVVDGDHVAFQTFVDAATGAVLVRKDLVHYNHPPGDFFTGQVPATDAACAPDNGPWTVAQGEAVKSIQVSAAAVVTTNDIVLHLVRDGQVVASQDTVFSPETLVYEPDDGGAGTYHVRVCDFQDAHAWDAPRDYSGQIAFSAAGSGTVAPYPPKWKVFPAYPKLGTQTHPWNYPSDDTREVWCWESTVGDPPQQVPECDREVQNLASRVPWDYDPRLNAPTFTTRGNNAVSAESWTSPLTPGPYGFRPTSASREYVYPWDNTWFENQCVSTFTPGVSNDVSAAVTNLFVMHNRMHDWSYFLGFTERHWNAQDSNFGTGGTAERDPLLGDTQAGGQTGGAPSYLGRDNANMIPLPDGVPPITNMYLWQPIAGAFYSVCVDGDFDMAVIGHEYTHAISNRMVAGPDDGLSGPQAGAMGESWSDLVAVEHMNEYGVVTEGNPFAVGSYVTGDTKSAIRNYGMNYSPLNYSNIGYDITGPQVHADGEIWSAINYDIRRALNFKYDDEFPSSSRKLQIACAEGERRASRCPGNRRWIQIVFDAFLLMQSQVSMVDSRDAYLAADKMRFKGENQDLLWRVFANTGLGKDVSSNGNTDPDPIPSFAPLRGTATKVEFRATGDGGPDPRNVSFFVGDYEARTMPVADTDPDTPAERKVDLAPGRYHFIARAPGYGMVRFVRQVRKDTKLITVAMKPNLASQHNGAKATGDGVNLDKLIDDTEATNWASLTHVGTASGPTDVRGRYVIVDLAGGRHRIGKVHVSAMLRPADSSQTGDTGSQNRFSALRQFALEVCTASGKGDCTEPDDFRRFYTSRRKAFPAIAPRPKAPHLIMRAFDIPNVTATHVRFVVLHNQCTGTPAFQGERDNDPLSASHCPTGTSPVQLAQNTHQGNKVRAAELQVFAP